MHAPVDEHLSFLPSGANMYKTTMSLVYKPLFRHIFSSLFTKYVEVELLCHMFNIIKNYQTIFQRRLNHFILPTVWVLYFLSNT